MHLLRLSVFRALATFVVGACLAATGFAQGSLTPPGAPGPTMKSLAQVEPRIPLVAGSRGVTVNQGGGITIGANGSYYLTANLEVDGGNGITVSHLVSHVTIDLQGFTLTSGDFGRGGTAIAYSGDFSKDNAQQKILIRNGCIMLGGMDGTTPAGFLNGIIAPAVVEDVTINDKMETGISALVVRRCHVREASLIGIDAITVEDCTMNEFNLVGITASARATNCTVQDFSFNGATAINAPLVENCVVRFNYGTSDVQNRRGILATIAKNCYVSGPVSTGIEANLAVGCATFGVAGNAIASKQDMP